MTEVRISTAMSDEELRLARIHDAVNRTGLDPTTILDLVTGLIEEEFGTGDLDDDARARFRHLIEDEAKVSLDKLKRVILDPQHFPHRHEADHAERLGRMRRRVRELTEPPVPERGEIGRGRNRSYNVRPISAGNSESYIRRRLRRDRPDLLARVDSGELSAHAAAIEAGFRKATITVPVETDALAAALRRRLDHHQLDLLVKALERDTP